MIGGPEKHYYPSGRIAVCRKVAIHSSFYKYRIAGLAHAGESTLRKYLSRGLFASMDLYLLWKDLQSSVYMKISKRMANDSQVTCFLFSFVLLPRKHLGEPLYHT